jgi:hypothetical protein
MNAAGIHNQRTAAAISRQSAGAAPEPDIALDIRGKNTSDNIPETNAATQSADRQMA